MPRTTPDPMNFRRVAGGVAAAVLLLIFGYLAVIISRPFVDAISSRNWRQTEAVVVASTVLQECSKPGSFTNSLVYQYAVDGRRFENNMQSFGFQFCGHEEVAKERADGYRVGAYVLIKYNELDPSRSVLVAGTLAPANYLLGGFYFVLIGVLFFIAIPQIRTGP